MAGPFRDVRFIPTGGIRASSLPPALHPSDILGGDSLRNMSQGSARAMDGFAIRPRLPPPMCAVTWRSRACWRSAAHGWPRRRLWQRCAPATQHAHALTPCWKRLVSSRHGSRLSPLHAAAAAIACYRTRAIVLYAAMYCMPARLSRPAYRQDATEWSPCCATRCPIVRGDFTGAQPDCRWTEIAAAMRAALAQD